MKRKKYRALPPEATICLGFYLIELANTYKLAIISINTAYFTSVLRSIINMSEVTAPVQQLHSQVMILSSSSIVSTSSSSSTISMYISTIVW